MKARRLPKSLSVDSIKDVWRGSRDSKSSTAASPGIDSVTAGEFQSRLNYEIARIRSEIQTGNFSFSDLRCAPIPKGNGSRIIAIPTVRDRLVQRCLINHLNQDSRFKGETRSSYGFTPGRNLREAQLAARSLRTEKQWVLKADIVKFFDNIPRSDVHSSVSKKVQSKIVRELLHKAIECEIRVVGERHTKIVNDNGIRRGVGLRQGMPVSPLLSNLLLYDFDCALEKQGYTFIRYADDLAFFCSSRLECESLFRKVSSYLDVLGLKIPELTDHGKTQTIDPSQSLEFLGVEIRRANGSEYFIHAPFKKIARIDEELAQIATVNYCFKDQMNLNEILKYMSSFVAGHDASLAVVDDREEFRGRLNASLRRAQESLFKDIFGESFLMSLNDEKKAILGMVNFPKRQGNGRKTSKSRSRVRR
jgi:group II intron reverse transcriptase/maturase